MKKIAPFCFANSELLHIFAIVIKTQHMKQDNTIRVDGTVIDDLSNTKYKVELDNGAVIVAYICGKMRANNVRVLVGDAVTVELSVYDLTNGRIVYRKNGKQQS